MSMKMDKKLIKRWIKALRSGKYKQTRGKLHRDGAYCCLGVLCSLEGVTARKMGKYGLPLYLEDDRISKTTRVVNVDFREASGLALYSFNDTLNYNFIEIAEILEAVYIDERLA